MTIKDLALKLGVSAATVSRALAGNPRISKQMRDRVEMAAAKSGYTVNRAARALVSGKASGFVGLVLTDPGYGREDSYLSEFITGLGQGCAAHGVDIFLSAIPHDQSELSVIRNIVTTRRADGLILARTSEVDARVDYLLQQKFPFVTFGRVLREDAGFPWLDTDGASAFAEAFRFLYNLGHRRFALVTIEEAMTFRFHRTEGLLRAIEECGDPEVALKIITAPRYDAALRQQGIRNALNDSARPTAILALFDGLAHTVLQEALALGISVPGDLSIVGFDNISSAAVVQPGLTTFDVDTLGNARKLAGMLVQRVADGPDFEAVTHLVKPKLILRGSHGPSP
ncbi:MAG: LacI family DNA-binding transcriptional regulator [Rhizobiaceae bacterium]